MTRGVLGSGIYTIRDEPTKYFQHYYNKNKERILAKSKERYDLNPDKFRKRSRDNYKNKLEKQSLVYKTIRENNKV
tara:strand:- start:85 stop:312 length:228 start_codon:yes stop_codon:yes gene_type:complete